MANCANCGFQSEDDFKFCPTCGTQRVGEKVGDPLLGRTLAGKYRVVEEIGTGSMGRVYRAEQLALKKKIAVKLLHRDLQVADEAQTRFQREGIAAGQVSHPNVIQIFDFERTEDGLFFLAMEYVDGQNLKAWLAQRGPPPLAEAIELTRQLLSTLVEAHSHGIIHRDLKPENLMIVESAAGERSLKVLDFGLSKLVDRPLDASQMTIPGRVLGTPMYMAPEQWRGDPVDHRTDLYAATLILYELLAGQPPFRGRDVTEAMMKTASERPPSLMESQTRYAIPGEIDAIVQRGLAKAPEDRYQSAVEMMAGLDAVRVEGVVRRPAHAAHAERPAARMSATLVIAAVAVVALIALTWSVLGGGGGGGGGGGAASPSSGLLSNRSTDDLDDDQRRYVTQLQDARDRLAEGDPAAALAGIESALGMNCADAEAFLVRAVVHRRSGDVEAAAADYREALQRYPEYGAAVAGLGWIHFEAGELDEAVRQFELAEGSGDGVAGLGAVLCARGEHDAALELLDAAAGTHPDNALVYLWRGRAHLAREDFAGAVQAFGRAKRNDESSWRAREGLGDAYVGRGNLEAAEKQYRDTLALAPDAPGVRRKLVEILVAAESYDSAASALAPALKKDEDDVRLLVLRGLIEQGRGQPEKAVATLQKALAAESPAVRYRVLVLLGTLELQRGEFAAAAEHCAAAAHLNDTGAALFQTWGLALFRLGDYLDASLKLERVIELEPDDAFSRLQLGLIYKDYIGDGERAKAHLRKYLENGGTDPRAQQWIDLLGG